MAEQSKIDNQSGVDRGLVAMFLKLSPEERLRANDNAAGTVVELRHGYSKRKARRSKSELNS